MKVTTTAASSDEPVTLAPVKAMTIDARLNGDVWVYFNYEVGVSGNLLKPGDHLEIKDEKADALEEMAKYHQDEMQQTLLEVESHDD